MLSTSVRGLAATATALVLMAGPLAAQRQDSTPRPRVSAPSTRHGAKQTAAKRPAARALPSADSTISRAVTAYARLRTARATFEQTLTNPLTGNTVSARGEYQQRRPGMLAVAFTEPAGDRIVSDGKAVWLYLPSTNPGQVVKLPAAEGSGGLDIASQLFERPRERYTIGDAGESKVGDRRVRVLTLVPKQPMHFTRATVWIDPIDGTMRQFEIIDATGLVRRVRLLSLRMNVPVNPSVFVFTPPANARVIDQTKLPRGN